MEKYKILKLRADRIIEYGLVSPGKMNDYNVFYQIDLDKKAMYGAVVEEQLLMESCALFDQFRIVLKKDDCAESIYEWLLQELVIVDFTNIYKTRTDIHEDFIETLITDGFIMRYMDKDIHMMPFDKSGNMSRKCRLSFINAEHLDEMNERLNIGIEFSKIPLKLSKFYAYRGLYLSTAKRIENELLKITPETLIVVDDQMNKEAPNYKLSVCIEGGVPDKDDKSKISFAVNRVKKEDIEVPFDGQGIISPLYADLINEILDNQNVNSFQIRLPFSKGMLHRVDFHAFLREFDSAYEADTYIIRDAFGMERDLKLANIVITKSMFKCFDWIKKFCTNMTDPMKYYCDALEKYGHTLYISSTDLPYGNSKLTHISYQLLNTLQLSAKQFESLINKQLDYIHNPLEYIKMAQGYQVDDNEEDGAYCEYSNWQRAVLTNSSFSKLEYIKNQLQNTQAALMTKLVLGKLAVKGQTRYMTRDLPSMLVNLIQNKKTKEALKNYKIFDYRFFLPQGGAGKNEMGLDYYTHCGFFRSPHLSRNEQGLLAPLIKNECFSKKYNDDCASIDKYFGHLTGVVMFGNESLEPMALGGADFDGDLVSMIMDEDVVAAIHAGVYTENQENPLDIERREDVPYIKIPSIPASDEIVPRTIPYLLIKNTFSNKIGLISNAAIAIGQSEYGNRKSGTSDVKCAHCTILTGLEIDAAKNGIHPDLSKLTDDESLKTCGYLTFKKEFEKLRKNKDYHFNQLWYEKNNNEYILGLKEKTIKYVEEAGTYINKLPIIFMENLNPKLNIPYDKRSKYFCFPVGETEQRKEDVFADQCNIILSTYNFYINLDTFIKKENNSKDYSEANLKKLLERQYDSEYVEKIITRDIPYLLNQLAAKINSYADFKDFTDKINKERWHLLSEGGKKEFLCEVLGVDYLDEDRWSIVLQSCNHNYKVLWYIVHKLRLGLNLEYSELKSRYNKCHPKSWQLHPDIVSQADTMLENYLETKTIGAVTQIYNMCLTSLRDMVDSYDLPISSKIRILFELTEKKSKEARLFWDCFEWNELEPYIVKEGNYAE